MEEWLDNLLDVFITTNEDLASNMRRNGTNSPIVNEIMSRPYTFLDVIFDASLVYNQMGENENSNQSDNLHQNIINNVHNIRRMLETRNQPPITQASIQYDIFVNTMMNVFEDQLQNEEYDDVKVTLTESEFDKLNIVSDKDRKVGNETCSICLDECNLVNEAIVELKCKHIFHKQCIKQWLTRQSTKCCVCRVDQRT